MVSREDVEALAKMANLESGTLAWMTAPKAEALPTPTPPRDRYQYEALADAEWEAIRPHWPAHNQASTHPRAIVNALLKIASTGCGWNHVSEFASPEAARLQFRRRKQSRVLATLPGLLCGQLGEARLRQIEMLARVR